MPIEQNLLHHHKQARQFSDPKKMDKFASKYSNGKSVSAAQYITELICESKAKKDKKDLHYRFWTTKYWERYYKDQIATAYKLLKKYEAKAIINALRSDKGQKIYSLRAPFLEPIIEQMADKIKSENTVLSKELDRTEKKTFRNNHQKSNIISKLKDLE
jgi:hypothetical protein